MATPGDVSAACAQPPPGAIDQPGQALLLPPFCLLSAPMQYPRRDAGCDMHRRYIARHHAAGTDHSTGADGDARQDDSAGAVAR